jgi:hypothetical protein
MSETSARLPEHPSLENLRKQAKELLRDYRLGAPSAVERIRCICHHSESIALADAQFVLAREYGFTNWPKLVHHVAGSQADPLASFAQLANDLVAACATDQPGALERVNRLFGKSFSPDELRAEVTRRLAPVVGRPTEFSLADVQLLVARQYGFASWPRLAECVAHPSKDPHTGPHGLSSGPPFYRIDWKTNTIEPRPPVSDQGWEAICAIMKEHGITGLNASGQLTDAALERLSRLEHVTRLNLGGTTRLTDNGIGYLARMPQLRELDMSDYPGGQITDRGLATLRHLTELRRFEMCWQSGVSDAGVAHLNPCTHLESVNLLGTQTGDGAIAALAGKGSLRQLRTGTAVTAAGLALLHQIPRFKTWHGGEPSYGLMASVAGPTHLLVPPTRFTHEGFDRLVGLDGLFGLNVDGPVQMTTEGLAPLALLPNLGWLGADPTDDAMGLIAALPRLRMLMCQDTNASDEGFVALSRSRTVEYIWGRRCYGLTGRGFSALAAMPARRGLAVSCKNVDDAALHVLPSFPALRALMPMDVSDDGFRHVGRCDRLEELWCMYCRDTGDIATGHIVGLSNLKSYYAGLSQITDESLKILGRMASLELIEFHHCARITDAGLHFLAGLPRLRELILGGLPGVTRDGVAAIPPHVQVRFET